MTRAWAWAPGALAAVAVGAAVAGVGCGSPPVVRSDVAPSKTPGSLGHACGDVVWWVSSGNAKGRCAAQVADDGRFVSMGCEDGRGDDARLVCGAGGQVACASSGTGICTSDEEIVRPAVAPPQNALAARCAGVAYFVIGEKCRATHDKMSGAQAIHCDDGAGDTADFACRDGVVACSATGSGVCHP